MLTFFNTKICNVLIVVWLSLTRVSGNFTCATCVGDSIQICQSRIIIDSCPVCAKVVNVSGVHITGVESYCDPTCQQVGCHDSTQSSCKLCCKSHDCSLGQASKLLFCFFNLAVSFISSSPEYIKIMSRFEESLKRTRGYFRYIVKPGNLMTHPNDSIEINININVYYRRWLVDLEFIKTDLERTITTSAANGSLKGLVESTPSFRVGTDQSMNPYAQIATIEQEGCAKRKHIRTPKSDSSVLTKEDALKILTSIDNDVENITSFNVHVADLYHIHKSMEKIASNKSLLVKPVVDRMLSLLGNLMGMDIGMLGRLVRTESISSRFRRLLQVLEKHVILESDGYLFNSKNIGISVKRVSGGDQPKDIYCTGFLRTSHDDKQKVELVVSNESSELGEGYAQVEIPLKEMLEAMLDEQRNMTRLTVMMLRKASFFENTHGVTAYRTANVYLSRTINSWVVGVFAKGYNHTQLPRFFTIKFRKLNSVFDKTNAVRWGAYPFSNRETWIHDGCHLSNYSNTTLTCVTDRLGFFAVLSENDTHWKHYKHIFKDSYRYIAMFGIAICNLECLITILAMLIFVKRIGIDIFYVLHINFTTSVLFSNLIILCAALGHVSLDGLVCELVALFFFYTLIVSHLWALVFVLFLFLYVGYRHKFDEMFKHILQVCLATWGVPAVYITIVYVALHTINIFTLHSQPLCIVHILPVFIFYIPLFLLLLVLGVVFMVKTFLLPWQTTNETKTQKSSVSSSHRTSTDTFMYSVTDQISTCLVFFLLRNLSSMFMYLALWETNNMLLSSFYAILVVFLGAAIMTMPWNFLSHIVRIILPKIRFRRKQSSINFGEIIDT